MTPEVIRRGRWTVLALRNARGDCPLLEFLTEFRGDLTRDGHRALALFERVARHGPPRNPEVSRSLGEGLWEWRQGQLRILWFFDHRKLVVCTHGFLKKTRKTPPRQLERARRDRERYLYSRTRRIFLERRHQR